MQIDAVTAVVWAAGLSGFFTSITAIAVTWFSKRTERANHIRELAMQAAVESWKEQRWLWDEVKKQGIAMDLRPLDGYFIHYLKLAEFVSKPGLSPKTLAKRLAELDELWPIVSAWEDGDERKRKPNDA